MKGRVWTREGYQPVASACAPVPPNTGSHVKKEDIIGHPDHYCKGRKYEPKDVIRDWDLNFNLGNTVKYIARNGRKADNSALQDLMKARQYLDFEIDFMKAELDKGEKDESN